MTKSKKTLWQKEKLLIKSNLFFCLNVYDSRLIQRRQKASVWEKSLKKQMSQLLNSRQMANYDQI